MHPTSDPANSQGRRANLAAQVRAHPFLSGFSVPQLETLIHFAAPTEFRSGQYIFYQGDPANAFYLILSGEVIVEADANGGGIQEVDRVHAGEVLGWSWLF
ncbi:MAG: cyclic nucleotide-binding domain-containing protein, partial [Verrucomicrobia bacterium]